MITYLITYLDFSDEPLKSCQFCNTVFSSSKKGVDLVDEIYHQTVHQTIIAISIIPT